MSASSPFRRRFLRMREAADRLGVSVRTLRRWVAARRIECHRTLGGHMRFDAEKIEEARKERTTPVKV